MSPVTLPNYEGDSAKTVSSTGLNIMQMPSDNVSLPYQHVRNMGNFNLFLTHVLMIFHHVEHC